MQGESYQPGRMGTKPPEMEGYGYGEDNVKGTFGSPPTSNEKPSEKRSIFDIGTLGLKGYLESSFSNINYNLLISKTFYFFFYAAFGSLFPLIGLYFKQLGMNPVQTGVLIGFRPFMEILAGPFWGYIAEKWQKFKEILLFALFCWVAFTLALAFIQPPANSCLVHNGTDVIVTPPWTGPDHDINKRSSGSFPGIPEDDDWNLGTEKRAKEIMDGIVPEDQIDVDNSSFTTKKPTTSVTTVKPSTKADATTKKVYKKKKYLPHPNINDYGRSPLPLDHKDIANLEEIDVRGLVSPPLSAVVYKQKEINGVFAILLVLMIIGEFVSSPAVTLADAATLGYLGDNPENYGQHRMFGSVGWALSMFIVGIALDHSNIFPNHPCGTEQLVDRNYTVCFAIFSVLMCCAFLTATQFKFESDNQQNIPLGQLKEKIPGKTPGQPDEGQAQDADDSQYDSYDRYVDPNRTGTTKPHPAYAALSQERKVQISLQGGDSNMISDATASESNVKASPFVPRGKPGQVGTLPQWMTVLKLFACPQHMSSIFILWYMGFGIGLVFAFLFWHLQDLHGTPTLFGFASVINHISEIFAFFYSKKLVNKFGHVKMLYAGLVGNVIRFMYVSWLRNPWWVLPFEFVQGLTHAALWATGCSYVVQYIPTNQRLTAQGILMAIHHGLGRGCGAIIGGAFINSFGSENTFRGYGIATLFVLGGYIALYNFYIKPRLPEQPVVASGPGSGKNLMEDAHLAPYGVPMPAMAHSMSATKLNDNSTKGPNYGSTAPKATNGPTDSRIPQQSDYSYDQSATSNYQSELEAIANKRKRHQTGQAAQQPTSQPTQPPQPEARQRETGRDQRDEWGRDQGQRDQPQRDQWGRDQGQRDQPQRDQWGRDQGQRDQPQKDQWGRDQGQRDQPQKDQWGRDQGQRDPPQRDQWGRDQGQRDQPQRDQWGRDQGQRDPPQRDQWGRDQGQRDQPQRDQWGGHQRNQGLF